MNQTGRRFGALLTAVGLALGVLSVGTVGVAAAPQTAQSGVLAAAPAGNDTCGYNDASFNESTITRSAAVYGSGLSANIGVFSNDEKALLLGVNGATQNTTSPQHVSNPSLGDKSQQDPTGRVFYPALYITDITNNANDTSGDWQQGGSVKNSGVDDVFGTWTVATIAGGRYTATIPPAKNDWNLGPGADTPPAGTTSFDEGYGSEVRWSASSLGLQPGHTYRLQMLTHDGDQNKTGGDAGEQCVTIAIPGQGLHAKKTVDKATANPGDTLTYTITVTNPDPVAVSGVDVSDDISPIVPSHGSFTSSTPPAAVTNGNQLAWSGQTVPASGSLTFTYVVTLATNGWPAGQTTLPNVVVVTKTNCTPAANQDPDCHTTTIVTPTPGLSVTKVADNANVTAGDQIGFKIQATNTGNTASDITINDPLPTNATVGITAASWSISPAVAGCSIVAGTLQCTFSNVAAGASTPQVHVISPTTAPAPGGGGNLPPCTVQVNNDFGNIDNTATAKLGGISAIAHDGICIQLPGVSVTKVADNANVTAGDQIGFKIQATNTGNTASDITINDPLPTNATVGITAASWSISPAVAGCSIVAGTLQCTFSNVAAGASTPQVHVISPTTAPAPGGGGNLPPCTVQVNNDFGNIDNTATARLGGISAIAHDGICIQLPGVSVTKVADNANVTAGDQIGFKIQATNTGNTASDITINDPLPTNATVGITAASWSISPAVAGCSIVAGTLQCTFSNVAAGASTPQVHVISPTTAPAPGGGGNLPPCTVQVNNDFGNIDNTATAKLGGISAIAHDGICIQLPGVSVTKVADNANVTAGDQIGFKIQATNTGNTASDITINDPLPTNATVGITAASWSISPAVAGCSIVAGTLQCTFSNVAAGASTPQVHVISPTTAPAPGGGGNLPPCTVQVNNDFGNIDNTATAKLGGISAIAHDGICIQLPGLKITKTADQTPVVAGNQVGFTITIQNTGNTNQTGLTLNDPLPTLNGTLGISWSIASAPAGSTCGIAGALLTCSSLPDLAAGLSYQIHVTSPTTAPAGNGGGAIAQCTTTVVSKNHTGNLYNKVDVLQGGVTRSDDDVICITSTPHITTIKTPDSQSVAAGNPVGFTITVKSDGNGTATAVGFNDALPTLANAGISWSISPAFAGPGTCTIAGLVPAQSLNCAFGDLAAGTQASVHVTSPTTAPAGNTTIAGCVITQETFQTNLNNSVTVTSQSAASSIAHAGTCVVEIVGNIHIVKTANPTLLPVGGGSVTYSYVVTNIGLPPLSNVTTVDDKCSPVVFLGGDTNGDALLQVGESWRYSCTTIIRVTTTNTATATGFYDDQAFVVAGLFAVPQSLHKVTDQAQAVVVVPLPSPTGSVQGATSPPKPHVTLPPTDSSDPLGSSGQSGMLMILILLAGIAAAVPVLVFGKRRQVRR